MTDFEINGTVLVRYRGKDKHVVIPDGVTEIGDYAFDNFYAQIHAQIPCYYSNAAELAKDKPQCATFLEDLSCIESVVIPEGVTTIGDCAFLLCYNLKKVTVPKSVTHIGPGAFALRGAFIFDRNPLILPKDLTIIANLTQIVKIFDSVDCYID